MKLNFLSSKRVAKTYIGFGAVALIVLGLTFDMAAKADESPSPSPAAGLTAQLLRAVPEGNDPIPSNMQKIRYYLEVKNTGSSRIEGIRVHFPIPMSGSYYKGILDMSNACHDKGNEIVCDWPKGGTVTLDPGQLRGYYVVFDTVPPLSCDLQYDAQIWVESANGGKVYSNVMQETISCPDDPGDPSDPPVSTSLQNAGFEEAGAAANQANYWQPFGVGYQRVTGGHAGSYAIRATTANTSQLAGAYQRIDLNQTTVKPVFVGGYVKGANISMASSGYLGAAMYAEIHLKNGQVAYWNSVANTGTFDWRWIGFNTGTVASVNQPISHILVVPVLGQATGTAYFDDIQVTESAPSQAAVTLMFDDGEVNTYTQAKPILDKYKFKGTSAVITSNPDDDPDFMTWAQVKALAAQGWEIMSHSVTHTDLTTLSSAQVISELANSKSALAAQGITANNFALPFGAYNGNILAQAAQYYKSARAYELGDNPQGAFPYDIKVRSITSLTTPEQVSDWINEAKANKRWEVLVFHTVAETGDDEYHTPPALLDQIVKNIANSGVPVITYDQGINQFGAKK